MTIHTSRHLTMAQDNKSEDIKWLYGRLKSQGYDIGTEDEFKNSLNNMEDREWYYEKARGMGLEVGDRDEFDRLFAPPAASGTQAQRQEQAATLPAGTVPAPGMDAVSQTGYEPESPWKLSPSPAIPAWGGQDAGAPDGGKEAAEPAEPARMLTPDEMSDFLQGERERIAAGTEDVIERSKRIADRNTPQGRQAERNAEWAAHVAGTPTRVLGVPKAAVKDESLTGDAPVQEQEQVKASGQSPVPHGVVYEDGKPRTEWVLPDGSLTTSRMDAEYAEYAARQARDEQRLADRMRAMGLDPNKPEDVQTEYLLKEKRRIETEMGKRGKVLDVESAGFSWRDMPRGGGALVHTYNSATANGRLADPAYKALTAQLHQVNEGLAVLDASKRNKAADRWIDDSSNWAARKAKQLAAFGIGSWRGLAHAVGKVSTWDMGMTDMANNAMLYQAATDADRQGIDNISQEERDLLNLAANTNAIQAKYGKDLGYGYAAGNITGESLPFMMEFILNPASRLGQTAVNQMMRVAVGRYGKAAVKAAAKKYLAAKIGTRVAGDIAGAAVMAGTTGQGRVTADMLNRMTGDVQFREDGNGRIVYDGREGAEDSMATALLKAFGAQTIENHSEMLGAYFAPILGKAAKLGRKGMEKIGLGKVNRLIDDLGATNAARMLDDFKKRTRWNGTVEEYAEEVAGGIENALLVGDNTLDTAEGRGVFNREENIKTFLGVGLMGGFFAGAKMVSYRGPKRRALDEMAEAGKAIDSVLEGNYPLMEQWGEWRNTFLTGTDKEKESTLREVMDNEELSWAFRKGVLGFVKAAQKYEGLSRAQESKVENGEQEPAARMYDASYDTGYETTDPEGMKAVRSRMEAERKRLAEILGLDNPSEVDGHIGDPLGFVEEQRKLGDEERVQAAVDYANARSAYEGMVQRMRDDTDSRIEESNRAIEARTHVGDRTLQRATLKMKDEDGNDRHVYVTNGRLVMLEDGSGIDHELSDKQVTVRDAVTGEQQAMSPDFILRVDEPVDAEEEKERAAQEIRASLPFPVEDAREKPVRPQTRRYELNEELELPDGKGGAVKGTVVAVGSVSDGHKGSYLVETGTGVNGKRAVDWYSQEELDGMLAAQDTDVAAQDTDTAVQDAGVPLAPPGTEELVRMAREGDELARHQLEAQGVAWKESSPALPRVPVNEQTGEPMFEKADRETALDALNEVTGGNEENTATIVNAQVEQAQKVVEALKKRKPTKKAPVLKGSPMEMLKAQQEAEAAYKTAVEQYDSQVAQAEETLKAWRGIHALMNERRQAVLDRQEAERKERERLLHEEAVARAEEEKRLAAARAAEQAEVGTHAVNPKIKEKWDSAAKVDGNANAITLADGSTLRGHYVLTEAGAATASHDVDNGFEPSEGFPVDEYGESVNDRDYRRDADAQRIVREIAGNYDSRALQSPVIVSRDGIVLSGNNRTMSGELAAQQGTDKAYVEHLREFGQIYGFTPEQIDGMEHPRVVFVPDEELPYDAATFARFNAEQQKRQSKPEQAVKLGKTVPEDVFRRIVGEVSRYDRLPDFYADDRAVASVLGELVQAGVVNEMQLPELRTGGSLSAVGREFVENVLIGKAFEGSPDAVRQVTGSPTLRQSVVTGLNEIAHNRTLTQSGYDLSGELAAAIDLVHRAKAAAPQVYKPGVPVSSFARQQGLFDDEHGDSRVTDATVLLLADVLNSGRPGDLRKVLATYNNEAASPAGGQMDMFSGGVASKEELLNQVNEYFKNATPREQQAAVDAAVAERKRRAEASAQVADGTESDEGNTADIQGESDSRVPETHAGLNDGEADELLSRMEANTSDIPQIELTPSNWIEQFGENGMVSTPMGEVKMGENQIAKLFEKGRSEQFGMIKPTLEHPHVVIEVPSEAVDGNTDRASSLLFIKTFNGKDGKKVYYFKSVTVKKDGLEVSVSSHYDRAKRVKEALKKGKLLYRFDGGAQTERHPADVSVTTSPNMTQGKDIWPEPTVGSNANTDTAEVADSPAKAAKGETVDRGGNSSQPISSVDKVINNQTDLQGNPEKSIANEGETSLSEQIAAASAEVNTEPTEGQKEAGNYKKGHVQIGTFNITIEQPEGSVRRGTDANGKAWETKMHNTYGYFRGTEGVDGDHIDVFLSNDIDGWDGRKVYVVDQYNPDGTFDEHKVMLGFNDMDEAKSDYLANYEKGWEDGRRIDVSTTSLEDFEKWIQSSHRKTKPFAEYAGVKKDKIEPENIFQKADRIAREAREKREKDKVEARTDNQGNPTNADGTLKLEQLSSMDELTDEDFSNPARNVALPTLPAKVDDATLKQKERQAVKEGGLILTLESAAGDAQNSLSSRDKVTTKTSDKQKENKQKIEPGRADEEAVETGETAEVLVKGGKWDVTGEPEKFKTRKKGDSHDVMWQIGKKRYGSTVAESDAITYLKSEHGGYVGVWNAYERGEVFLSPNEAAIVKAVLAANGGVRLSKSDGKVRPLTVEETALRDAVVDRLRESGIEVIDDVEEGQRVLELANEARESKGTKKAPMTAELTQRAAHTTVVTSADGAKVIERLDNLVRELENLSSNRRKTFLGDIAKAIGAERHGSSSQYATFEARNGKVFTIRLANHNASVSSFDNNNEAEGISVVVSGTPNQRMRDAGEAHVVEFFYPEQKLRKADGKPLAEIVKGIKQALYSGEYKDTTGLAEVQEVNRDIVREHRVYHGSVADFESFDHSHMGEGEGAQAYGWGTYVTEVKGIGRMYAEAIAANRNDTSYIDEEINEIKRSFRGLGTYDIDHGSTLDDLKDQIRFLEEERKYPGDFTDAIAWGKKIAQEWEKLEAEKANKTTAKHLYSVEIPDDTGSNYLDYTKRVGADAVSRVGDSLEKAGWVRYKMPNGLDKFSKDGKEDIVLNERASGADLYKELEEAFGSDKAASGFLSETGFVGVSYPAQYASGSRVDGARNYVIFNESDMRITDHVRFFRTSEGEAYGFTVGGKIYIDPRIAGVDTPIHEYAHLWASALRQVNPEEWKNVVELMKGTPVWDEVRKLYPNLETDEEIADEVLATYSGRRGAERLREEQRKVLDGDGSVMEKAEAVSALERVRRALQRFWKGVADFLHIHYTSAEEVADRVMKDLLEGVDPRKFRNGSAEEELDKVNERFNEELNDQLSGSQAAGHIYALGRPSDVLLSTGIPDLPIELAASRLAMKSRQQNHPFDMEALKDLPKALQHPIAVFSYGDKGKAQNIIIEIEHKGKNFVVGLHLNQNRNGLEVNSIRGLFPKDTAEWLNWINQGKLLYADKEKIQTLIDQQRINLADVDYLDLDSAAKIVESFENPSVEAGNPASGREAMRARAEELSERLHTPVRIVGTDEEVSELPSARRRRAKGWTNTATGEVVIVIPNHTDVADVENTVLHEVVGHDGLRVLFPTEERLNRALDELYRVSEGSIRDVIDAKARKLYAAEMDRLREKKRKEHEAKGEDANAFYYVDMADAHVEASRKREELRRTATEEYGADLAGRIGEEGFERMSAEERTFWGRLKAMLQRALQRLLDGLHISGKRAWTDKEWAFVLHESYKRKKNGGRPTLFDVADTEVMRWKTGFGETTAEEKQRQTNVENMKHKVADMFIKALNGEFKGRPQSIGRLTSEGRAYLEQISGIRFKEHVDFVLNPSDLLHIYKEHFGENEKDRGNNEPLTMEDIKNMVYVISSPDRIVYGTDREGKKLFFFLKAHGDGTYNLAEVYGDKRGNLTAKSFYNTKKKGISQRVNEIKASLHTTSETSGEFLSSGAKIPTMFEINEDQAENIDRVSREASTIVENAVREGRYMKAPNGAPSKLDARQWVQVRTSAFKAWAGDWENDPEHATVVLDENGEPLVVYHGTDAEFTTFDPERGDGTHRGMYFTDSKEMAASYKGGKHLMPVFLNLRDVYEFDGRGRNWEDLTLAQPYDRNGGEGVVEHAEQIVRMYRAEVKSRRRRGGNAEEYAQFLNGLRVPRLLSAYRAAESEKPGNVFAAAARLVKMRRLRKEMERYFRSADPELSSGLATRDVDLTHDDRDGIIFRNIRDYGTQVEDDAPHDVYVVYDPNNIKSATGNNGEFSRENNDIMFRDEETEDVNERFNEELGTLTEKNADSVVFSLGRPSAVLKSAGVRDMPMKLYGNKVMKKMRKHGFALEELRDLPRAVADPIAVFNNYGEDGNRSVLTELHTVNGNFLVAISLGKGKDDIDFNIISSVFGKGEDNIVDWLNRGFATYINKEKALNYLHHSALRAVTSESPRLNSATKVVKDFVNPTAYNENVTDEDMMFRDGDGALTYDELSMTNDPVSKVFHIEKGKLLSIIPTIQKAGMEGNSPLSEVKDKRLLSILQADEDIMFRDGDEVRPEEQAAAVARTLYEEAVRDTGDLSLLSALVRLPLGKEHRVRFKHKFAESFFDYSRSVKALQDALEQATGRKVESFEDAWKSLNTKSSMDQIELDRLNREFIRPLSRHIGKMIGGKSLRGKRLGLDDVEMYMNAVHGLERNRVMAERDAEAKAVDENGGVMVQPSPTEEDYDKRMDAWEEWRDKVAKRKAELLSERRDYSGLTALFGEETQSTEVEALEDAARRYITEFEATVGHDMTDELWRLSDALNGWTLRKAYLSGLIGKEQYEDVRKMYQHYVPLRGWHDDYAGDVYSYISRGSDSESLQSVMKRAYGRKSRAAHILGTMAAMANMSVVQGNKNLVAQKFLNCALNTRDAGLLLVSRQWYVKEADGTLVPDNPTLTEDMSAEEMQRAIEQHEQEMEERSKTDARVVRRMFTKEFPYRLAKWQEDKHRVRVLRNSVEYQVYVLGNPRAAMALNGLLNPDSKPGIIQKFFMAFMRFRAKMLTSLNVEFWVGNFQRDVETSLVGMYVKHGGAFLKKMAGNLLSVLPGIRKGRFNKGIFRLMYRYEHGMLDMNDPTERMFREFCDNGGITGISSLTNSEEFDRQMNRTVREVMSRRLYLPKEAIRAFFAGVEFVNRGVENATRFAAYMTMRSRGENVLNSVFEAKNASVNFNMKGSGAWGNLWMRRNIVFTNAALQALRMLGEWYGASRKRFFGVMGGMVVSGYLNALLCDLLFGGGDGDDDDDKRYGEDDWYRLSEWNRYNFLNIGNPFGHGYLHWSISQEFRPAWALGQIVYDLQRGRLGAADAAKKMAEQVNNLTPVAFVAGGSRDADDALDGFIKGWTPTLAADFLDAYHWNKDFLGYPITNQHDWNVHDPEWQRASKDTPKFAVELSRRWNNLTGGRDNRRSGWDSKYLNPSALCYLAAQQTGGVGTLAKKLVKMVEQLSSDDEKLELRNIPFMSKFYVETGDDRSKARELNERFMKLWSEFEAIDRELRKNDRDYDEGKMSEEEVSRIEQLLKADGSYALWQRGDRFKSEYEYLRGLAREGDEEAKQDLEELKREFVSIDN